MGGASSSLIPASPEGEGLTDILKLDTYTSMTASAPRPTLIDLFCGAGGISHGFAQEGFKVLGGVDNDGDSVATFSINHLGGQGLNADLASMSPSELARSLGVRPGEVDCLAGGPPCQGFSRNRAFRHKEGEFVDDPRNHLYWHFFDFIDFIKPRVVLMENVPEILIKANGYFRDAVFARFDALGYSADARVLNAADYGVPQRRRRAIFLAGREGVKVPFPEATSRPGRRAGRRTPLSPEFADAFDGGLQLPLFDLPVGPSVWDAIGDLRGEYGRSLDGECAYASPPFTDYQGQRRGNSTRVRNHFPWPLTERQLQRIRLLAQGQGQAHLPKELQTAEGYGSAYRRLQADAQALTLTTWMFHPGSGMFTHPFEDRVLTIREAARIQSFQDDFVFTGRYHSKCRQVGNAVAPLVARNLARSIIRALGYSEESRSLTGAMP